MMDDEFDADPELLQALTSSELPAAQPAGQRTTQPIPQRLGLEKASSAPIATSSNAHIVQPTPQALPGRSSGSAIQVSPRQKGNPVLACIKNLPWEYSDIPADYVLGMTTCALFLSLKYHRLHPEYIYTRIQNLKGKYSLRIILAMVDITSHEDPLRELSKTSLVNGVTLILCWSAQEAARYLELYKSLEHAGPASIKGRPPATYSERVVEFVTVPRGINRVDAITLVSGFGTLHNAVNADPDAIVDIPGWGQRKIRKWSSAVQKPFRAKKAARRFAPAPSNAPCPVPLRDMAPGTKQQSMLHPSPPHPASGPMDDGNLEAALDESVLTSAENSWRDQDHEQLSDGIAAALARLRQNG